MYMTFTWIN